MMSQISDWRRLVLGLGLIGCCIALPPLQAQENGLQEFPKLQAATDWPWWRGPQRDGKAGTQAIPTKFSDSENVVWKVAIPGRGHSSPIVVGNKVFLTTADAAQQRHLVLCLDRTSGKTLWEYLANRGGFPAKNHVKNTEATPTIACDGERIFATFYGHDQLIAVAVDLNGQEVWKKNVAPYHPRRYEYGYAPSPQLYGKTVILAGEFDGESFLTALDRATGKQVWKTPRPNNITFSTPVIAPVGGKDQLLISGAEKVSSYNPATGKPLWSVPGTTAATCGTMVWDGDYVFASGGYPKAETIAIRIGKDGKGQVAWKNNQKCYEQSMLAYDGYLYGLTDNGIMFCWRGSDGKEMWKERLTGPVSASPVMSGGHIYWANELGTMYVFKPNPQQFELVAENQLGNDSFASPAVAGSQLFLRVADNSGNKRQEWLYCIGQ